MSSPVGPTSLRRLDASCGRQDHTISPSASASFVLRAIPKLTGDLNVHPALPCHSQPDAAASTASHPAFLTIAIRPSSGTRRVGYELIRTESEHNYFLFCGLTAQITPDLGPALARRASFFSRRHPKARRTRKNLTRRANHRHIVIIATIRCPRRDTGRGFFFVCRMQASSRPLPCTHVGAASSLPG